MDIKIALEPKTVYPEYIQNFEKKLRNLRTENEVLAAKRITQEFSKGLGNNSNLYVDSPRNRADLNAIKDKLIDEINHEHAYFYDLVNEEYASPYSIFNEIFEEPISDIIITRHMLGLSGGGRPALKYKVPQDLTEQFQMFVKHLIDNVKYVANAKFDASNAILDATVGIFRFNLVHESLNSLYKFPVIAIRKQTNKQLNLEPNSYLDSLGLSENQIKCIREVGFNQSYIIAGTVGSGKAIAWNQPVKVKRDGDPIDILWEDLLVGDVFECGSKTEEIRDWEIRPCYRIESNTGETIKVSDDHLINCQILDSKFKPVETKAMYGDEEIEEWLTASDIAKIDLDKFVIVLKPFNTYIDSITEDGEDRVRCITTNSGHYVIDGFNNHNTTLLRYMANYRLDEKRNLCVIEDTSELFLDTMFSLLTNQQYTIKELFTAALRQNPSHLLIGETRTEEILDILEVGLAFPVGTTIHADAFNKAIERIVVMSSKRHMARENVLNLILNVVTCIIIMEDRKVMEVWYRKPLLEVDMKADILKNYMKIE